MNKEIADMWITALRSGEYPQTMGRLENLTEKDDAPIGFCCLGVLSALAADAGVISREVDEVGNVSYGTPGDMCVGELTDAVIEWAGMNSADGTRNNSEYYAGNDDAYKYNLMGLNDTEGYTFPQIADVIAAEFDTL